MSLSRESSEEVHIALGKQGGIFDGLIDLIGERSPGFYEQTSLATYAPSRFKPEPVSSCNGLKSVAAKRLRRLGYMTRVSPMAMNTGSAGHLHASRAGSNLTTYLHTSAGMAQIMHNQDRSRAYVVIGKCHGFAWKGREW